MSELLNVNFVQWELLLKSGIQAFQRQDDAESVSLLRTAYRLAPGERDVRYWLANALRSSGNPAESEQIFRNLLDENPADTETAFALAFLLREQANIDQAATVLEHLINVKQQDLETLLKAVGFLRDSNRFDEAIRALEFALLIEPGEPGLHFKLARLLQATGNFDQALDQFRQTLDLNPGLGGAWLSLAQLQKFEDQHSPDWQRINLAVGMSLGQEADMCLAFSHGKALDDVGEWQQAWNEYTRGNQLRHAGQSWDRKPWSDYLSQTRLRTDSPVPAPDNPHRHPVFIVGMLRSGTTVLEQLLALHPEITGRGELNFLAHIASGLSNDQRLSMADRKGRADELWKHMRQEGPDHHRYIDKNPLNFRFLGQLLDVLPETKIIHVVRDGRDSCLSCFFQLFQHPDAGFTYDLEDLLDYYKAYRELMSQWQSLAGDRIHMVRYEELVSSKQATLEGVLNFLGLEHRKEPREQAAEKGLIRTASAWQARQKLHNQSISRWKNYYPMASKFFDSIAELDRRFN